MPFQNDLVQSQSSYNIALANTLANFQSNEEGVRSQLQFGAGWWFNDTKLGMIDQMNAYAEQGMLANFVGMLTDSRSFYLINGMIISDAF